MIKWHLLSMQDFLLIDYSAPGLQWKSLQEWDLVLAVWPVVVLLPAV